MPRHVRRTPNYDVSFSGIGIKPVNLTKVSINSIARILDQNPSDTFLTEYAEMVAIYVQYKGAVSKSSPAAVLRRLDAVRRNAQGLQASIAALELTDAMLFGRFAAQRLLRKQNYAELEYLAGVLSAFLPVIKSAVEAISREPRQGRMPAFAEEALAQRLHDILASESKLELTTKPGGCFDRMLRLALSELPGSKPRRDVVDLMRVGLGDDQLVTPKPKAARTGTKRKSPRRLPGKNSLR